jgi:DNA-binding IclR family transcriptional regulator
MPQQPIRLGIKAVEISFRILKVLSEAPSPLTLKDIAALTAMSPSKAHRYLLSLIRVGAAHQDLATRRYALGAFALQMGLSAVGQADELQRAIQLSRQLRDTIDQTIVVSIWGEHGPTIIHIEESSQPVQVTMRVGSVLPIPVTAAGRVFAAYLPKQIVEPIFVAQLKGLSCSGNSSPARFDDFENLFRKVRHHYLATSISEYRPGIATIAAPLLNVAGDLVAVIAAMGQSETMDCGFDGPIARELRHVSVSFTENLGSLARRN